ncbi:MAG: biotin--[acetyl-CoA-carboxylase] ligase [Puniceicoccales bacterium]|jgi:BirA family biotin operon repressor/biotin-[acetyl-CoA-carboxylase] ligase|nr:biotin--[acetyl-CoA-carboxylase] ligase [Puniceicoccales bacterium]
MEIFRYAEIDSTNSQCFRQFDLGQPTPFAVIAGTQTQGRGQFGRTWYSGDPRNLYLSVGFVPRQSPKNFQNFSMLVTEKIADFLQRNFHLKLGVKHPNDIHYQGKKLCGILTESRISDGKITFAVTGIGLNIGGDLHQFPQELRSKATTLSCCCGREILREEVEEGMMRAMLSLLI